MCFVSENRYTRAKRENIDFIHINWTSYIQCTPNLPANWLDWSIHRQTNVLANQNINDQNVSHSPYLLHFLRLITVKYMQKVRRGSVRIWRVPIPISSFFVFVWL